MSIGPGTKLGVYEVLAPLGKGGMGEVFRGRDTKLGRDVAVKVLPAALARDPDRLARFDREARALAALNHPNIAQIYGVEQNDGVPAMMMELVPGETLGERIKRGAMPLDEALNIAAQMASALDAAHEKGIIHRDFKPGNVMVTPDGVVKVLDFGLVGKAPSSNSDLGQNAEDSPTLTLAATQAGVIMGTAAYMAPEQAAGKPVDKRADIWSFGVVLWEMLTGKRAFEGETVSHVLAAVLTKDPDLNLVPDRARPLLARCLEKDPKKRLRDIGDAMQLIGGRDLQPAAGVHPGSFHKWQLAAAALALVAAALAFLHFRETPPAPTAPTITAINPPEGVAFGAAEISPDGTRLAFVGFSADGKDAQLYLRPMDSPVSLPLSGTEGAQGPIWSPDSRFIGFFADGKLKKIDSTGGPAITLTGVVGNYGGASWSATKGVLLFEAGGRTFTVPAAGGVPTTLANENRQNAWFLPDGRHYAYLDPVQQEIRVASLDAADLKSPVLVASKIPGGGPTYAQGHILFRRDDILMAQPFDEDRMANSGEAFPIADSVGGDSVSSTGLLVYRSRQSTLQQLTWLDRTGKVLSTVSEPGNFVDLNLSPDGRSLMTSIQPATGGAGDLWLWDLTTGLKARFTFDPTRQIDGQWTADGRSFIYRKTNSGIYRKKVDGGAEELIQQDTVGTRPTGITPDGKLLLYGRFGVPTTGNDIWALPLSPDSAKAPDPKAVARPFRVTSNLEDLPQVSPDGKWVAYRSSESGRIEIYIAPFVENGFGNGAKWQVSTAGGTLMRWRRDGKELFFLTPAGQLMAAEITATQGGVRVGKTASLFGGLSTNAAYRYDVSADGQRIIAAMSIRQRQIAEPLTVVSNWLASVKK